MPNALAGTRSPYLLQHQHNPVDWRPWGSQAFAEAVARDVPVFLSVGYSTCYWCHVMARESFEDATTASLMNELFVCVKLDREERPDVDDAYMAAVQAFTNRGGWPMSVFLEPAGRKPFWAGTYLPPTDRHGMPSFSRVLRGMSSAWREQREKVLSQAEALANAARERLIDASTPVRLDIPIVTRAASELLRLFDADHGGFGGAPKFPQPAFLDLLLAVGEVAGDGDTKAAIDRAVHGTLRAMALGGINDQIAGGFHRYSVDAQWLVPHFEKMLYDNAQLLALYARAAATHPDPLYTRTATGIVRHLLRDLRAPCGGFFAALDAESNHREGESYVWTPEEVAGSGIPDAQRFLHATGLDRGPNFRDPHHPDDPPRNVLFLTATPAELAAREGLPLERWSVWFDDACDRLLDIRSRRPQPSTDFKILAGWNGLAIGALAEAGVALRLPEALRAARDAADFVLGSMRDASRGLLRCHALGTSHTPAFLEDYAMLAGGLARLAQALGGDGGPYTQAAIELVDAADALFGDPSSGAYFDAREDAHDLWVRARSVYDGAIPSGGASIVHALLDLRRFTGDSRFALRAGRALAGASGAIARSPTGAAHWTHALLRLKILDRAALDSAMGTLPAGQEVSDDNPSPVAVLADADEIGLSSAEPAVLNLRLQIAPGYHVIAAEPDAEAEIGNLAPLRVGVAGGTGVKVYAEYPVGEPVGVAGMRVRVYSGDVDVPVVIERSGEWSGAPALMLVYQACSDDACLLPARVELDVKLVRV